LKRRLSWKHKIVMRRRFIGIAGSLTFFLGVLSPARAQDATPQPQPDPPPFSLPFTDPPGPNTWLYEQHYGNTTSAFNYGEAWYAAGQGMHFGIDFEAMCGTPVHASADGVVGYVDADGFGAGPHNLILEHPGTGYTSLYGHLAQVPQLARGQVVRRGEQIGVSGDPDGSCESRPHLHLEIRNEDFTVAYNPIPFFDVNWHMLTSIGPVGNAFQQDLDHPYQWMKLEDQPAITFGQDYLNDYIHPWPPRVEQIPPYNPPIMRRLEPVSADTAVVQTAVSTEAWNIGAWWRPTDSEAVYVVDTVPNQDPPSGVFRQPLDGSARTYEEPTPPTLYSPAGDVQVERNADGSFQITRLADLQTWTVYTEGSYPAVSPDGTRLLWQVVYGEVTPGTDAPGVVFWVSNLDGTIQRRVHTQAGGYGMWLDSRHLLFVKRITYTAETQLFVLDIDDPAVTPYMLGSFRYLRGLQVAPGGQRIAFFVSFQDNPDASGVYVLPVREGAAAKQLPFWGAFHWRDDRSLYTLSFDPESDLHSLSVYDLTTNKLIPLTDPDTLPIRVANGEWSVSSDGTKIVYVDPVDYGLYLLTVGE